MRRRYNWITPVTFLILPVGVYLAFVIGPTLNSLFYSLTDWAGYGADFNIIGFANFQKVFTDRLFRNAIGNTVIWLALAMVVPTLATLRGEHAAAGQLLPTATHEMLELAEREGAEYLQRRLRELEAAGVNASATVARGEPASVIASIAQDLQADLVVLGTHGSGGVEAFWTGSVGQRLIDRLAASFLLAPAGAQG